MLVNSITLIGLGLMLLRSFYSLWNNTTTIEEWEIERHHTLLRRARAFGGYLDCPDGTKIRVKKQEFPYDIGIWKNFAQVLGSNPLTWLWPLSATPSNESGLEFEVNGFEGMSHLLLFIPLHSSGPHASAFNGRGGQSLNESEPVG